MFTGVRPSSAAAASARSSGSDFPNATGSACVSAPEDGRTPPNTPRAARALQTLNRYGDPAYNSMHELPVGRVPSRGGLSPTQSLRELSGLAEPDRDPRIVRFNHARANDQCRSTVRGARSRAAAISGTVMPTK